jgi:ribose transport system permease protein
MPRDVAAAVAGNGAAASSWPSIPRRVRGLVGPLAVLLALCALLAVANPVFLEFRNFVRIANAAAIPLILGCGATFIILMGSIDLSVEGGIAVGTMIVASLAANDANTNDYGWWAPLLAVVVVAGLGLLNGVVHVGLRIPSFMTTLGTWFVGLGIATVALGGSAVRVMDPTIRALALHRLGGFPLAVWVAVAVFLVALGVQNHTRFGRYLYAIGGGEEIAALSGVPVRAVRIMAFAVAGLFTGIGAVLAAAQLGQSNAVIADGRLFMTVTAVVVGGTALTGGEGGVGNTLIGVLIVTVLANGMILLGISPYVHQTAQGLMIIAAVALSTRRAALRIVK